MQWLVEGIKMYINLWDPNFQHYGCSNCTVILNCKTNFVRYKSYSSCLCMKGDNVLYNQRQTGVSLWICKAKTTCKQRLWHHYWCNMCKQVAERSWRSTTAISLTNKLSNKGYQTVTPFQFFTLCRLWVMAFTGVNITSGRADSVMPWR